MRGEYHTNVQGGERYLCNYFSKYLPSMCGFVAVLDIHPHTLRTCQPGGSRVAPSIELPRLVVLCERIYRCIAALIAWDTTLLSRVLRPFNRCMITLFHNYFQLDKQLQVAFEIESPWILYRFSRNRKRRWDSRDSRAQLRTVQWLLILLRHAVLSASGTSKYLGIPFDILLFRISILHHVCDFLTILS